MGPSSAKRILVDVKDKDFATKRAALAKIYKEMPPVMRHFFFKKHKVPSRWFDLRLNYSRSVAVMSIIGHIVGLGDRHVSNILMDEVSGDLVAIDLGIAFDAVSINLLFFRSNQCRYTSFGLMLICFPIFFF